MSQDHSVSQSHHERELAYAVLVLERQLNAYRRLHEEDLTALRQAIEELKEKIVLLHGEQPTMTPPQHSADDSIHSTHS